MAGSRLPSTADAGRTRGFVESPLQLLGALESAALGLLGEGADIAYRAGLRPLDSFVRDLARVELPRGARLRPTAMAVSPARGVWAVGDAFSGQVQAAMAVRSPREVVVLDDGLATLHLLTLLCGGPGGAIVRSRGRRSTPREWLGRATHRRLLALMAAGRLTVATALPVPDATASAFETLGGRLVRHGFAWSGTLPLGADDLGDEVVVGSAMAADGLVRADAYRDWVAGVARAAGSLTYLPHRREDDESLARLSALAGVSLLRTPWPVEPLLTRLRAGAHVHCLPSTPLLTLSLLLPPRGVQLSATVVPDDWWLPGSEAFRANLERTTTAHPAD